MCSPQDKSLVDYVREHCLDHPSTSWTSEQCLNFRQKLQNWPLTCDLNHAAIRHVIDHLTQLEAKNQLDTGTCIEMQNRLNQLARLGKCDTPQTKRILDGILTCDGRALPFSISSYSIIDTGKRHLTDRDGFQFIQSYRSILDDLVRAIELESCIQQLTSKHLLATGYNVRFRQFLYRILENHASIGELVRYRAQLKAFFHVKHTDISPVKRFIQILPKDDNSAVLPLTLADQIFERLRWDRKPLDPARRDQLLKVSLSHSRRARQSQARSV